VERPGGSPLPPIKSGKHLVEEEEENPSPRQLRPGVATVAGLSVELSNSKAGPSSKMSSKASVRSCRRGPPDDRGGGLDLT